ncbi:hypothetical protein G3O06_13805 [Burkholderia sp. Ac-20345]|uniref:DUF937 domain-containing protein n=1 Tax=Burkholderia sp. Ac-20345 TaxID=2703891 RepID=UPI00197BAC55|nr:DUF937 domain-containing protein [Burkholderia sp. Ac-20345]MBN3778620.1 hypothetical protein [Burkholderia sp. Ac-20345]
MKNINVATALNSALSGVVLDQLSQRFGLAPDVLDRAVTTATSGFVAALMMVGATADGASRLMAAVMDTRTNARIVEQLQGLSATTIGVTEIEASGQMFALGCFTASITKIADLVVHQCGVPPQTAVALTAVVSGVLGGLLKHHMLIEQGSIDELTQLLDAQWSLIESRLTDEIAIELGFCNAVEFRDAIQPRLRAVAHDVPLESTQSSRTRQRSNVFRSLACRPSHCVNLESHPSERFVSGVLLGFFVSMIVVVAIAYLGDQWGLLGESSAYLCFGVAAGISAGLLLVGPMLQRSVWRHGRDIFTSDIDLNQAILGRVVGLVAGLVTGAAFAASWY